MDGVDWVLAFSHGAGGCCEAERRFAAGAVEHSFLSEGLPEVRGEQGRVWCCSVGECMSE